MIFTHWLRRHRQSILSRLRHGSGRRGRRVVVRMTVCMEPLEQRLLLAGDGTLDTTFGNGAGYVTSAFGSTSPAGNGLVSEVVTPSGQILLGGTELVTPGPEFAVARYNVNGTLDGTFGSTSGVPGHVATPVGYTAAGSQVLTSTATGGNIALDTTNDGFAGDIYQVGTSQDGPLTTAGNATQFTLLRYTSSGVLDSTFGNGGIVTTSIQTSSATFPNPNDQATNLVIQPDGKIVVVGFSTYPGAVGQLMAIVRYNTDGTLDTTFGGGTGIVTTTFVGGNEQYNSVIVQPNGQIVAAGYASVAGKNEFAIARYNADGTLDNSFNGNGEILQPFSSGGAIANSLALQSDGQIVVAGGVTTTSGGSFAIARFNTNGSLDTSFGSLNTPIPGSPSIPGGTVTPLVGTNAAGTAANSVLLQSDGKIVIAGVAQGVASGPTEFAMARLTNAGILDSTFGTAGVVLQSIGTVGDGATAIAHSGSGTFLVAGYSSGATAALKQFAIARFTGDPTSGSVGAGSSTVAVTPATGLTVNEGGSPGAISVSLNTAPAANVTISLSPSNSSVAALTVSTLTFTPQNFNVPQVVGVLGVDDNIVNGNQTFTVSLTSSSSDPAFNNLSIAPVSGTSLEGDAIPMYRAFNPNAYVHFFTTSLAEFQNALAAGWQDESTGKGGFDVLRPGLPGSVPLHRLYDPNNGQHYLTANNGERDALVAAGWVSEPDQGAVYPTNLGNASIIFGLYNTINGEHLYTANPVTNSQILAQFPGVWIQQSPLGFGYPTDTTGAVLFPQTSSAQSSASSAPILKSELAAPLAGFTPTASSGSTPGAGAAQQAINVGGVSQPPSSGGSSNAATIGGDSATADPAPASGDETGASAADAYWAAVGRSLATGNDTLLSANP